MPDALALVQSPDVAALEGLKVNEVDAALATVWPTYARRTLADAWGIGRALRRVKDGRTGRAFRDYLDQIKMGRPWAYRLLQLADGYKSLDALADQRSVQGAVKALAAAPKAAEPPAPAAESVYSVDTAPEPTAAARNTVQHREHGIPEPEPAVAIEAVAAEAVDPAADREAALERLAIRTEDIAGDVVDGWAAKLDAADERHRGDVAALDVERRIRQGAERRYRDVIDALLAVPRGEGDRGIDDVLAARGVARKAAA